MDNLYNLRDELDPASAAVYGGGGGKVEVGGITDFNCGDTTPSQNVYDQPTVEMLAFRGDPVGLRLYRGAKMAERGARFDRYAATCGCVTCRRSNGGKPVEHVSRDAEKAQLMEMYALLRRGEIA